MPLTLSLYSLATAGNFRAAKVHHRAKVATHIAGFCESRLGTLAAQRSAMRKPAHVVSALVVVLPLFVVGRAHAQEPIGAATTPGSAVSIFGAKGTLAISSEAGATFSHTSISGVDGGTTTLVLRPGVDYFVIPKLSVGAFVGVDHQSQSLGSTTTFGVGPRVGYDIAFSDRFSIWPRVGFSFNHSTIKIDAESVGGIDTPSSEASNDAIAINLFAPLMYHTQHVFAGVGPALDTDLSGDAKATTFAIRATLGGWLF